MYQRNPVRRAAGRPARARAVAPAPVPDWSRLAKEDDIEVQAAGGPTVAGTIDMIAADRSVFWMIRRDGGGRTMVCCGDDVAVVKVPRPGSTAPREHAAA